MEEIPNTIQNGNKVTVELDLFFFTFILENYPFKAPNVKISYNETIPTDGFIINGPDPNDYFLIYDNGSISSSFIGDQWSPVTKLIDIINYVKTNFFLLQQETIH